MIDDSASIERWLPVLGWEAFYEVSDLGSIRSLDRYVTVRNGGKRYAPGRMLRATPDRKGYLYVGLKNKPVRVQCAVHVLVLQAFVGPKPDGKEGCHGDGDHQNNRVVNLRWDTSTANHMDMVRHRTHYQVIKLVCPLDHLLEVPNLVPSQLPGRSCLACSRARANAQRWGYVIDFHANACQHYEKIMMSA